MRKCHSIALLVCLISIFSFDYGKAISQTIVDVRGFKKMKIKFEAPPSEDRRRLKTKDDVVILSFFEMFEDSVLVYQGKKMIAAKSLFSKNNPFTSSGWSGFDLKVTSTSVSKLIKIFLLTQREFVEFRISKRYPFYVIQRYNGLWYVRALKQPLNSK